MARRVSLHKAATFVRQASLADLGAIEAIENAVFDGDRLSHRSLLYYLKAKTAVFLVLCVNDCIAGYSLVGFRKGARHARLNSIALDPAQHGRGLGRLLLGASERAAKARGAVALRLEVRIDNPRAIALYEKNSYQIFAKATDYYEDGASALRFEKPLAPGGD
jgi:ribosomal-protein-alanine N-acetyltransferase